MPNEAQQRQWNNAEVIERWKVVEPSTARAEEPLFAALQPRPGERILDIGCGGGGTTLRAATEVGPTGLAVGCDISAPLVDLATTRARERGLTNVTFHEGDAQVADIPGGPFDAAISRYGVMFFADPPAAFANIRRHLKPAGRLAFVCWREAALNPWYPSEILARYAPPAPPSEFAPPGPFALGDEAYRTSILQHAGFGDITTAYHEFVWQDPPGLFSGPAQIAPLQLPPERAERALAELRAYESQFLKDGMLHTIRRFVVVTARNR
jgi:SAM-dependent methyltransferase